MEEFLIHCSRTRHCFVPIHHVPLFPKQRIHMWMPRVLTLMKHCYFTLTFWEVNDLHITEKVTELSWSSFWMQMFQKRMQNRLRVDLWWHWGGKWNISDSDVVSIFLTLFSLFPFLPLASFTQGKKDFYCLRKQTNRGKRWKLSRCRHMASKGSPWATEPLSPAAAPGTGIIQSLPQPDGASEMCSEPLCAPPPSTLHLRRRWATQEPQHPQDETWSFPAEVHTQTLFQLHHEPRLWSKLLSPLPCQGTYSLTHL